MTPDIPPPLRMTADLSETEYAELRERFLAAQRDGKITILADDTEERIAEAVAAERERCAQLAEQVDAQYPWYHAAGGIQRPVAFRPFAALLREARP